LKNGKPIRNSIQTSEKVSLSYQLEVKHRGGHSSLPTRENAIYRLAEGLARLSKFNFPFKLNETTRAYFERTAELEGEQVAADIRAVPGRPFCAISVLSRCQRPARRTSRLPVLPMAGFFSRAEG
jgi:hypothetical protein